MDVKRGRLPLTALRSFEAAGRLLNFSRAAEELFVSQAAISRQIRELEAFIGKPLFKRLHRRVELTEQGRLLLAQLTASFDDIDQRLWQVMEKPAKTILHVSVEPAFATALLVPRLKLFRELYPDVEISVDAEMRLIEFRDHGAEIAIRYGAVAQSWPRTQSRHLLDVRATPVIAPELLASGPPLTSPADLGRYTLLHETNHTGWALWFRAAGLPDFPLEGGPLYADAAHALQAAKLGHGVALGDRVLEGDDFRNGTLVRPFELAVPYGAYWLVAPDFQLLGQPGIDFAEWIVAELATDGTRA